MDLLLNYPSLINEIDDREFKEYFDENLNSILYLINKKTNPNSDFRLVKNYDSFRQLAKYIFENKDKFPQEYQLLNDILMDFLQFKKEKEKKEGLEEDITFKKEKIANAQDAWNYLSYATQIRKEAAPGKKYEEIWKILFKDYNPTFLLAHHIANLNEPIREYFPQNGDKIENKKLIQAYKMGFEELVKLYLSRFHKDLKIRSKLQKYFEYVEEMEDFAKYNENILSDPKLIYSYLNDFNKDLDKILKLKDIEEISKALADLNLKGYFVLLNPKWHLYDPNEYPENEIKNLMDLINEIKNKIEMISLNSPQLKEIYSTYSPKPSEYLKGIAKKDIEIEDKKNVQNIFNIMYNRMDNEKALGIIKDLYKKKKKDTLISILKYRNDLIEYIYENLGIKFWGIFSDDELLEIAQSAKNEVEKKKMLQIISKIRPSILISDAMIDMYSQVAKFLPPKIASNIFNYLIKKNMNNLKYINILAQNKEGFVFFIKNLPRYNFSQNDINNILGFVADLNLLDEDIINTPTFYNFMNSINFKDGINLMLKYISEPNLFKMIRNLTYLKFPKLNEDEFAEALWIILNRFPNEIIYIDNFRNLNQKGFDKFMEKFKNGEFYFQNKEVANKLIEIYDAYYGQQKKSNLFGGKMKDILSKYILYKKAINFLDEIKNTSDFDLDINKISNQISIFKKEAWIYNSLINAIDKSDLFSQKAKNIIKFLDNHLDKIAQNEKEKKEILFSELPRIKDEDEKEIYDEETQLAKIIEEPEKYKEFGEYSKQDIYEPEEWEIKDDKSMEEVEEIEEKMEEPIEKMKNPWGSLWDIIKDKYHKYDKDLIENIFEIRLMNIVNEEAENLYDDLRKSIHLAECILREAIYRNRVNLEVGKIYELASEYSTYSINQDAVKKILNDIKINFINYIFYVYPTCQDLKSKLDYRTNEVVKKLQPIFDPFMADPKLIAYLIEQIKSKYDIHALANFDLRNYVDVIKINLLRIIENKLREAVEKIILSNKNIWITSLYNVLNTEVSPKEIEEILSKERIIKEEKDVAKKDKMKMEYENKLKIIFQNIDNLKVNNMIKNALLEILNALHPEIFSSPYNLIPSKLLPEFNAIMYHIIKNINISHPILNGLYVKTYERIYYRLKFKTEDFINKVWNKYKNDITQNLDKIIFIISSAVEIKK